MSQRIISVSQLVRYLKGKLDSDNLIQRIFVQGEISNFTNHRSGHWYFTLKDETSRISCVMFQSYARQCGFIPKNGDKVLLQANTSVFEGSGSLQLYGIKMQLDGIGELYLEFERLKRRLAEEGLFAKERKKPIPAYPMKIGLVTGKNTAAREDVVSTLKRRWPCAKIVEFATLVQGEGAVLEIIDALDEADQCKLDVILLVRGGGSIEDLWAFNSELLARKIVSMDTPLIAGIGHEVDVTIADYAADLRAPTPTGAAEMAAPVLDEVLDELRQKRLRMMTAVKTAMQKKKIQLENSQNRRIFKEPESLFEKHWMKLNLLENQLMQTSGMINTQKIEVLHLKNRLNHAMETQSKEIQNQLVDYRQRMIQLIENKLKMNRNAFIRNTALLDAYSPLKSLARGYSLVYQNNKLMDSVDEIEIESNLEMIFQDGKVRARVFEKEKNHEQ